MVSTLGYRQEAVRSIQKANYMLNTTYPLLKEPKTLLSISSHIYSSFMSTISALLYHERLTRKIPPYHETEESKLNSFKQHLVIKHKLKDYSTVIDQIKNLSEKHKKAPIEFSRNNKFVICSDNFTSIETLSKEDVENYIQKAKEFLTTTENILSNE